MVHILGRTARRCLIKLKIELPYDPVIPFLGMHPNAHRSTVNNSQDIKTIQVPINESGLRSCGIHAP